MKHIIGKRLAHLRGELATHYPDQNWSQNKVAEETGLTQNIIARMELTGAGTIEAFLALVRFYYQKGCNPAWILLDDNAAVPVFLGEELQTKDTAKDRSFLLAIKHQLEHYLAESDSLTQSPKAIEQEGKAG
jgi:hypothetical protein